jgi:hypothetical protein
MIDTLHTPHGVGYYCRHLRKHIDNHPAMSTHKPDAITRMSVVGEVHRSAQSYHLAVRKVGSTVNDDSFENKYTYI